MNAKATTTAEQTPTKSKEAAGIVKRTSFYHADPKTITRRPGFNPRFEFGEIDGLARSIKVNGVLMPLRVKRMPTAVDGKIFELVDGDRRLTAIETLLKKSHAFPDGVPVIIVDKDQKDVTSLVQMFEANSTKTFLPLEKAAAFKQMRDAGMTIKDIEKNTGCSDNDIVGCLALLDGDETLIEATKTGKVSGSLAKSIAVNARGNKKLQAELTKEAVDATTSKNKGAKRAVLKKVDEARRDKAAKKGKVLKMRALDDKDLSAMGVKLAEVLKTKLTDQGMDFDADLRTWLAADPELMLAATFGALEALKAAAGLKINLEF